MKMEILQEWEPIMQMGLYCHQTLVKFWISDLIHYIQSNLKMWIEWLISPFLKSEFSFKKATLFGRELEWEWFSVSDYQFLPKIDTFCKAFGLNNAASY